MNGTFERALEGLCPGAKRDEPMARHCSWRMGGPADWFCEVEDDEQAAGLLRLCRDAGVPLVVTGGGSNLLWSDEGLRGVVMKIGPLMGRCECRGSVVAVQAGLWGPELARRTAHWGLSGLEHTIGIPGCVGGLIHMNGGSLRQSVGDCLSVVTAMNRDGEVKVLSHEDCEFSYRHSVFQENGWVVLAARFVLTPEEPKTVRRRMADIAAERRGKFPLNFPNCGSVFSNEPTLFERFGPPGRVIDQLGLKGTAVGPLQVSERHANFFVNRGGGRAAQALELIGLVRRRLHEHTGLWVPCEVRAVTPDGRLVPAQELTE